MRRLIRNLLVERVTARRVTALLGPRRYGKTSVLREVAARGSELSTVWVDLFEVVSIADAAIRSWRKARSPWSRSACRACPAAPADRSSSAASEP